MVAPKGAMIPRYEGAICAPCAMMKMQTVAPMPAKKIAKIRER
jgi:hypothetical protein